MKMVNILSAGVLTSLLIGCSASRPDVVNFPFVEGNTMLPATEVMSVERTDSSTVVTLMTMYDYYDTNLELNPQMYITTGDDSMYPLADLVLNSGARMVGSNLQLQKGVPAEYKLIFPPISDDARSVDIVGASSSIHGIGSIWGIDLTSKRSANEWPDGIPSKLLKQDFSKSVPTMVDSDSTGTATVRIHAVAFRTWMSPESEFVINKIDDKQEILPFTFDEKGEATISFPINGTAQINVFAKFNTYSSTYIDPNETIDFYVLPNNYSESQRRGRPKGVSTGKYHNSEATGDSLWNFYANADTLLFGKTDRDEYFDALIRVYETGLDSLAARNFPPEIEQRARGGHDRKLMNCTAFPRNYITESWYLDRTCTLDSFPDFTPEQLNKVRSLIDFNNPAFELYSIGNPGNRSNFLKAKELITQQSYNP